MANVFYNFIYDGTLEGLFCVFVRCINMRVKPRSIKSQFMMNTFFTAEYMPVRTDDKLADKFYRYIRTCAGVQAQQMVQDCFLTSLPEKEVDMFYFVYKLLKKGPAVCDDYEDESVRRIQLAIRDLYREGQSIASNINYTKVHEVDVAVINPRNIVLPIIKKSLSKNIELDDYMAYDKRHRMLLIRRGDSESIIDTSSVSGLDIRASESISNAVYNSMWNYFAYGGRLSVSRGRGRGEMERMWEIA